MSLFRRGTVWWLYIVHNGRRFRRSTGESEKRKAQIVHDDLKAELRRLRPGRGTFHAALDTWSRNADPADVNRVSKLKRLYPDRPLHAVTAETLAAAIPDTSAGTFNRYVNLITAALNRARRDGLIDTLPNLTRRKQKPGRIRWLTPQEWKRLDRELPDHLRPLARFALATGLRQRNVTHLEWSQIDLERKVAWIHADQAKARRAIGIPLSTDALAVLKAQQGQHDRWVFPYRDGPMDRIKGGRPTAKTKGGAFQRAVTRAGLHNFTWHDLRHTWASWHVQRGTPLNILKELGGWATMQMVLRYAHLAPEHLARYANNSRAKRVA